MRKSGFTLIEIIISITIMGLVVGFGVAQYRRFNARQVLQQAALTLRNDLRLAQEKALAGKKDCDTCQPDPAAGGDDECGSDDDYPLLGWFIEFVDSDSTDDDFEGYEIYGACDDGGGGAEFGNKLNGLFAQAKVKINSHDSDGDPLPATIRFNVLRGSTNLSSQITIILYLDDLHNVGEAAVTISPSGEIR